MRAPSARLALAAASLAAALGAGEILARAIVPSRLPIRFEQLGAVHQGRETAQFLELARSDPELFWRLAPNRKLPDDCRPFFGLVSNSRGLREDHEIPPKKREHEVRALFLGDSCTFGYGLAPEDTFVQRVEDELGARFPERPIECINAGVPGWSLFQGWRLLETEGFAYQPDLVVVAFGWNDNDVWDGRSDEEYDAMRREVRPPPGLRWSRLAELGFSASRAPAAADEATERPRLLPAEFTALLDRIEHATREHGADLLLLVLPGLTNLDPEEPRSDRLPLQLAQLEFGARRSLGSAGRPAFVDGVAAMHVASESHGSAELFLDHVHPTALGNRVLAAALVERIDPWLRSRASH